jgi:hypothetical protein
MAKKIYPAKQVCGIAREVVYQKFSKIPRLATVLLDTGSAILAEGMKGRNSSSTVIVPLGHNTHHGFRYFIFAYVFSQLFILTVATSNDKNWGIGINKTSVTFVITLRLLLSCVLGRLTFVPEPPCRSVDHFSP